MRPEPMQVKEKVASTDESFLATSVLGPSERAARYQSIKRARRSVASSSLRAELVLIVRMGVRSRARLMDKAPGKDETALTFPC